MVAATKHCPTNVLFVYFWVINLFLGASIWTIPENYLFYLQLMILSSYMELQSDITPQTHLSSFHARIQSPLSTLTQLSLISAFVQIDWIV